MKKKNSKGIDEFWALKNLKIIKNSPGDQKFRGNQQFRGGSANFEIRRLWWGLKEAEQVRYWTWLPSSDPSGQSARQSRILEIGRHRPSPQLKYPLEQGPLSLMLESVFNFTLFIFPKNCFKFWKSDENSKFSFSLRSKFKVRSFFVISGSRVQFYVFYRLF